VEHKIERSSKFGHWDDPRVIEQIVTAAMRAVPQAQRPQFEVEEDKAARRVAPPDE